MADFHRSSSSYQNSSPPHESHVPEDGHPQGADSTLQQQSGHHLGTNSTSVSSYTRKPRHVVLYSPTREEFEAHIRGPYHTKQAGRDLYDANSPLSHFADVAVQESRITTGASRHQEYQQDQPTWQASTHAGIQPYQQIQTDQKFEPFHEGQSCPTPHGAPGSHVPPRDSERGQPPAKPRSGPGYPFAWTEDTDKYILKQGQKVVENNKIHGGRYKWSQLSEDFARQGFGFEPKPTTLSFRFFRLRRAERDKEKEARQK